MKKPKLHVVGVFPPPTTGMTLVTKRMSEHFKKDLSAQIHPVSRLENMAGWRWTLYKHKSIRNALRAALDSGGNACYYVPDSGLGLLFSYYLHAPLLAKFSKVVLHHHVYSYIKKHDPKFARILARIEAGHGSITHIVLSQDMADRLIEQYHVGNVRILGNSALVAPELIGSKLGHPQFKRVGFLSNVTPEKGIRLFIDTVRQIDGIGVDIAGPIDDATLRAEIDHFISEDPERRKLWGPVYESRKTEFFQGIDALMFPSSYAKEAQPLTIYEALSVGIPVIATIQGSIPEQLKGTGCVFSQTEFVNQAQSLLRTWRSKPDAYQKACQSAETVWKRAQLADNEALTSLTNELKFRPAYEQ